MLCYKCFKEYNGGKCPQCGYEPAAHAGSYPQALKPGTELKDMYIVGEVLG